MKKVLKETNENSSRMISGYEALGLKAVLLVLGDNGKVEHLSTTCNASAEINFFQSTEFEKCISTYASASTLSTPGLFSSTSVLTPAECLTNTNVTLEFLKQAATDLRERYGQFPESMMGKTRNAPFYV